MTHFTNLTNLTRSFVSLTLVDQEKTNPSPSLIRLWKYLTALVMVLCLGVGEACGTGTALSSLNFSYPSSLPSAYTYSSSNTPSIATNIGSKNCVYVADGGGITIPTFSVDNSSAPTGGKRWMAFQPAVDCSVTISVYSNKKIFYLFDKDHNTTSNCVSTYTNSAQAWESSWTVSGLKAGTWYVLGGNNSQSYVGAMTFSVAGPETTADTPGAEGEITFEGWADLETEQNYWKDGIKFWPYAWLDDDIIQMASNHFTEDVPVHGYQEDVTAGSGWGSYTMSGLTTYGFFAMGISVTSPSVVGVIVDNNQNNDLTLANLNITQDDVDYDDEYDSSNYTSGDDIKSNATITRVDEGTGRYMISIPVTASDLESSDPYIIKLSAATWDEPAAFVFESVTIAPPTKDYTVTAVTSTGTNTYGTVVAADEALDEDETTTITATPATGYQVTNWAASGTGASVSPSGASNSNTTTLTMGAANATVTATFGPKSYTVTLNNQSATTAGTESVTTTYAANTNLTSAITCPTKTSKVFAGYFTGTNGTGVQLIDPAGNWIASAGGGSTYLDASKNWKYDDDLTLYACWMEYCPGMDMAAQAISLGSGEHKTWTGLTTNKILYSVAGNTTFDDSSDATNAYDGLKFKNEGDYILFLVQANSSLKLYFGYTDTKPKISINGGAEADINVASTKSKTPNQEVDFGTETYDRLIKIRTVTSSTVVLQEIDIAAAATCPSAYSFHYGPNGGDWETPICFTKVGETNEWRIEDFTIPSHTNGEFWVGYAGATNGQSVTKRWTDDYSESAAVGNGAMLLLPTTGSKVGQATGATGTISIWSSTSSKNQYVGFKPDGYAIMYDGNNYVFSTTATNHKLETDVVTLPDVSSTTYQMGIKTSSSYTTCAHSSAAENINAMGMSSIDGGKRRIWLYSTYDGWITAYPKMAIWDATHSRWGDGTDANKFMTKVNDNLWYGYVTTDAASIILVRVDPNNDDPAWGWGQTFDILPGDENSINNYVTVNGYDDGEGKKKFTYTIGSAHPTTGLKGKFRMWDNSDSQNWYVHFVPYYVLTYDANGGTGSTTQTERNSESSTTTVSVASNGFTAPTGYSFAGWNTAEGGGGVSYAAGADYTLTANGTLYAQWSPIEYTITLAKGEHGAANKSAKVNYDAEGLTSITHVVEETGYQLDGYYDGSTKVLNADGTFANSNVSGYITSGKWNLADDCELTAKWTAKTYTVTLDANTSNHGSTGSSVTATFNDLLPSFDAAVGTPGYQVEGYYTTASGEGTKIINANGTLVRNTTYATDEGTPKWKYDGTVTLYARYELMDACYTLTPSTSGDAPSAGDIITGSGSGGVMEMLSGNFAYSSNGLEFLTGGGSKVSVALENNMKAGTVIMMTLVALRDEARGLYIYDKTGKNTDATLAFTSSAKEGDEAIFTYTVTGSDHLYGTNGFQLWRNNDIGLKSIRVMDCGSAATKYNVTYSGDNASSSDVGTGKALSGGNYTATFAAESGYKLPDDITVTINSVSATQGTDYFWNSSTGKLVVPGAKVTGNIAISFDAESDSYAITHNTPTGSGTYTIQVNSETPTDDDTMAPDGATITLAASAGTGYSFSSWTVTGVTSGDKVTVTSNRFTMPDEAVTVDATFTINSYTLTWNLDGGIVTTAGTGAAVDATGTPNSSVTYNADITAPEVTKSGYDFAGWSPSVADNMPAANTTYTATWAERFTVTYDAKSGSVDPTSATGSTVSTVTLPEPTRTGYIFDGWYDSGDEEVGDAEDEYGPTADITLYAKWTRDVQTAKWGLTFNDFPSETSDTRVNVTIDTDNEREQDGSGEIFEGNQYYNFGDEEYIDINLASGYYLTGITYSAHYDPWRPKGGTCAKEDGCLDVDTKLYIDFSSSSTFSTSTVLNATPIELTGNEYGDISTKNSVASIPAGAQSARIFADGSYEFGGDLFYLAVERTAWDCTPSTVSFNAGGATSGTAPVSRLACGETILPGPGSLTKSGYRFDGWNDGTSTYYAGATYDVAENVTFTAQWRDPETPLVIPTVTRLDASNYHDAPAFESYNVDGTGSTKCINIAGNRSADWKFQITPGYYKIAVVYGAPGGYSTDITVEIYEVDNMSKSVKTITHEVVTTTSATARCHKFCEIFDLTGLSADKTYKIVVTDTYGESNSHACIGYIDFTKLTPLTITDDITLDYRNVTLSPGTVDFDVKNDGNEVTCLDIAGNRKAEWLAYITPNYHTIKMLYGTPAYSTNVTFSIINPATGSAVYAPSALVNTQGGEPWYEEKSWSDVDMRAYSTDKPYIIRVADTYGDKTSNPKVAKIDFIPKKYDLDWDANGGDALTGDYSSGDVAAGVAITAPDDPTRTGYDFVKWNSADDGSGNDFNSKMPLGDVKYYAQWAIQTFTITWQNYDGTTLETDASVEYGATPSYDGSTPTKASTASHTYAFNTWSPAVSSVTGDATYTATFTESARSYSVTVTLTDSKATQESGDTGSDAATYGTDYVATFKAVSGYKLPDDVTVSIGGSTKTKDSEYTWSVSEGVGTLTIDDEAILGNIAITVTAEEDVITYSVTYAAGVTLTSGDVPEDDTDYLGDGTESVTVLGNTGNMVYTGYTFRGWTYNGTFYLPTQTFDMPASNVTLTAVWDRLIESCIEWAGSPSSLTDGAMTVSSNLTLSVGNSASIDNDVVWSGSGKKTIFKIDGSARYVQGSFVDGSEISSVTVSAATNQSSAKVYAVVFCASSGFSEGVTAQTHSAPSKDADQDDSKLVHEFTAPAGTKYFRIYRQYTIDETTYGDNQTIRVYGIEACNEAYSNYTVSFADQTGFAGSSTLPDDVIGVPSGSKILQPGEPSAEGYVFEGWVTTSGGSTPFDFANTTITSNTTIYASWSECPERATITSPTTPQSIKLYTDRSKTLTVEATPYSSGTLQYQWKKDGVNIVGATSASYTVYGSIDGSAGNSYVYTCEVTQTSPDACVAVTSPAFTVTFASPDCGNNVIIEAVRKSGTKTEESHDGALYGSSAINTYDSGKLGGTGNYFGLTLKSGYYFQNGDKLYVKLNTINGNGDGIVVTAGLDGSGTVVGTLDNESQSTDYNNEITLSNVPASTSSIVIYRTASVTQNPFIDAMKVKRYTCPGIFIFDDAADNGEWSDDDNWIGQAGHGSGLPTSDDRVFINESITVDTEDAAAAEVHLASEKTMTVEKSVTMGDVIVETGATLNVAKDGDDGIEMALNSLSLKGGWNSDKTKYDMPRVYINPDSKITREVSTINFDISVDNRNYYPIALPFDVPLNSVDYAESYIAEVSEYGTHYEIDEYDGEKRAEYGGGNNNWKTMAAGSTLKAGTGYILSGLTVGGKAIIRFPMNVDDAWLAAGEKGTATVSAVSTTKNEILVTAYVKEEGTTPIANKGWNLIGVPFMSCYTTGAGMYDEENVDEPATLIAGRFDYSTGKWTEKDPNFYVTVPTHDFTEFKQSPISEAVLMPGWCFFVQVEKTGSLIFLDAQQATSNSSIYEAPRREQSMPTIKTGIILSGNEASDRTTFLISDKYSAAEYEINADLEKMFGENSYTLATYSLSGETRLAYNAMSRTDATNVIPIGYRAPAEGEYTFAINPRYAESGDFERIDLIDYETGFVTNLLQSSYTFTSDRTQSDSRFALNVVPSKETPTDIEPVSGDGEPVTGARKVIIDNKLYIILNGKMYDAKGVMVK